MGLIAVFGGSGRLGESIVRKLAHKHAVRFTYGSQADASNCLVAELAAAGQDVAASQVDVGDAAQVDAFLAKAEAEQGRISAVVSAIGSHFAVYPFQEAEFSEFRRVIELDVFGNFHIMKSAAQRMGATGGGAIVVLLTAAILRTATYDGMSSIPKTAVAGMIRQLARDAGGLNVRCNGIAPGVVDTDKVADIASLPDFTRVMVEDFMQDTALKRLNNPDTISALTEFLISDVAADISGQIIGADGGYSA